MVGDHTLALRRIAAALERLADHFVPEVKMPKVADFPKLEETFTDEELAKAYAEEQRLYKEERAKKSWRERYGL